MLDPKTLKKGSTVIFFGKVELEVKSAGFGAALFLCEESESGSFISFFSEPWWKHAELKKPMPDLVCIGFTVRGDHYFYTGTPVTPSTLLHFCKDAAARLEAAGYI
jgi:hypothetical protein